MKRTLLNLIIVSFFVSSQLILYGSDVVSSIIYDDYGGFEEIFYSNNQLIVKFHNNPYSPHQSSRSAIDNLQPILNQLEWYEFKALFAENQLSNTSASMHLNHIYSLSYQSDIGPFSLAKMLSVIDDVYYAEPRIFYTASVEPNDNLYDQMYHLEIIKAADAWDVANLSPTEVTIAIIDTGVDMNHEDLIENAWKNEDEIAGNGIDDDNNGFIDDVNGWNFKLDNNNPSPIGSVHGTFVGGIASAMTNNEFGVSSLSWNTKFMAINSESSNTPNLIGYGWEGVVYAIENGADVVNCSWGGYGKPSLFALDVLEYAKDQNVIVVCAAGNNARLIDENFRFFPASHYSTISVGATQDFDVLWSSSNYGKSIDVYAPGHSIYSTGSNHSYFQSSGTSFASPMVAALAALVIRTHPSWSPAKVKAQLRATSDNIQSQNATLAQYLERGRINSYRCIDDVSNASMVITDVNSFELNGNFNEIYEPNETIGIELEIENFFQTASSFEATLQAVPNSPYIITDANSNISVIQAEQKAYLNFEIEMVTALHILDVLNFLVLVDYNNVFEHLAFQLTTQSEKAVAHHVNDVIATSITSTGNIGAPGLVYNLNGFGFRYKQLEFLREASLIMGTSSNQLSNCAREFQLSNYNQDFQVVNNQYPKVYDSHSQVHVQRGTVSYDDSNAPNPLNVLIEQKTLVYSNEELSSSILLEYKITNNNSFSLDQFHIGLFIDYALNGSSEKFKYYPSEKMITIHGNHNGYKYAALKSIDANATIHMKTVAVNQDIPSTFSREKKWNYISQGIQNSSPLTNDAAVVMASGPYSIAAHDSLIVRFAMIIAETENELLLISDLLKGDSFDVAVSNVTLNDQVHVYPNPVDERLNIFINQTINKPFIVELVNGLGQTILQSNQQPTEQGKVIQLDLSRQLNLQHSQIAFLKISNEELDLHTKIMIK